MGKQGQWRRKTALDWQVGGTVYIHTYIRMDEGTFIYLSGYYYDVALEAALARRTASIVLAPSWSYSTKYEFGAITHPIPLAWACVLRSCSLMISRVATRSRLPLICVP